MITLHRLGHAVDTFQINPDAITTIEATPDTVITILNGQKIVVAEPPHRVAEGQPWWWRASTAASCTAVSVEDLRSGVTRRNSLRSARSSWRMMRASASTVAR